MKICQAEETRGTRLEYSDGTSHKRSQNQEGPLRNTASDAKH